MTESEEHLERPDEGQIVFVHGGVAQYRDGVFYTGMEDPRWTRQIVWDIKWWLPITDWSIRTIEEQARELTQLENRLRVAVEVLAEIAFRLWYEKKENKK